jgi:hypothetical protein
MVLAAAAALVSGCESLENLGSLLDTKTKLSGDRKPDPGHDRTGGGLRRR